MIFFYERLYFCIFSFKTIPSCFHLNFDNLHACPVSRVKYNIKILNFSMKLYKQKNDKIDKL